MKHLRSLSLLALVAAFGLVVTGCSDDVNGPSNEPVPGDDDYTAIDFDDPTGGLTASDEPIAFGDAFLLQEDAREEEELFDDALMQQDRFRKMLAECDSMPDGERPLRNSYFLRVVWGNLDGPVDPESGEVVDIARMDWSGMLQINDGAVIVRRLIRFERGIDSITRPRIDPQTIEWTSFTGGHFDGILFQIVEPVRNDEMMGPDYANNVKFQAGSFTANFTTADIPGMDRTANVDDENSIRFLGFEYNGARGCPRGFLAGIWHDDPETEGARGGFRGRWVNILGTTMGYVQGGYGLNEEGERVLRAKYISRRGEFKGFVAGTWEPGDEPGLGSFHARWMNRNQTVQGVLGGRYKKAGERPGGFFQGRWTADCDRNAEDLVQ
jgi:hypothetical protein